MSFGLIVYYLIVRYFSKRQANSDDATKVCEKQSHILHSFRRKHRNSLENSEISTISSSNVTKITNTEDISKKSDEAIGSVDSGIADIYGSDLSDEDKEQQCDIPREIPVMVLDESKDLECNKPLHDSETVPAQTVTDISNEVDQDKSPIEKVDIFVNGLKSFQYKKDNNEDFKSTPNVDIKLPAERLITDFTIPQV